RSAGGRGHPHRLREGLHQGRGRLLRRPGRGRVDGGCPFSRQGPAGGQGLRDAGRRRRGVQVQRLKSASDQGFYLLDFLLGSTEEFRSTISCLAFIPLTCAFSRPIRNLRRGPTLVSAVRERLW